MQHKNDGAKSGLARTRVRAQRAKKEYRERGRQKGKEREICI